MLIITVIWIVWSLSRVYGFAEIVCKESTSTKLEAETGSMQIAEYPFITVTLDSVKSVTELRLQRSRQDLPSQSVVHVVYSQDNLTWSLESVPVDNSTTAKQFLTKGLTVVQFQPPIKARYLAVTSDDGVRYSACNLWGCSLSIFSLSSFITPKVKPTFVTQDIKVDTRWTLSNSPYVINGSRLTVQTGAHLLIDAGVDVVFKKADSEIFVQGSLVVEGTAELPVRCLASSVSTFFQNGLWKGINITGEAMFTNLQLYGAKTGISSTGKGRVAASRCRVESCETGFALTTGSFLQLANTVLWRNRIGFYIAGKSVSASLVNCSITGSRGDKGIIVDNVTDATLLMSGCQLTGTTHALRAVSTLGLNMTVEDCSFTDNGGIEVTGVYIRTDFRKCRFTNNIEGLAIELKSRNSTVNISGCSFTGNLPMMQFALPSSPTSIQVSVNFNEFILDRIATNSNPVVFVNYAKTSPGDSPGKTTTAVQFFSNTFFLINETSEFPPNPKNVLLPLVNYRVRKSVQSDVPCVMRDGNRFCLVSQTVSSNLPNSDDTFTVGQSNVIEFSSGNLKNSQINIGSGSGDSSIQISGVSEDSNSENRDSADVNMVNINGKITFIPADQSVIIEVEDGETRIDTLNNSASQKLGDAIKRKMLQQIQDQFRLRRDAEEPPTSSEEEVHAKDHPTEDHELDHHDTTETHAETEHPSPAPEGDHHENDHDTTEHPHDSEDHDTTEHPHDSEDHDTTEHPHDSEDHATTEHPHDSEDHATTEHSHDSEDHATTEHSHDSEDHDTTEHSHDSEDHDTTEHSHDSEDHDTTEHSHDSEDHDTTEHSHDSEDHVTTEHSHDSEDHVTTEHSHDSEDHVTTEHSHDSEDHVTTEYLHDSEDDHDTTEHPHDSEDDHDTTEHSHDHGSNEFFKELNDPDEHGLNDFFEDIDEEDKIDDHDKHYNKDDEKNDEPEIIIDEIDEVTEHYLANDEDYEEFEEEFFDDDDLKEDTGHEELFGDDLKEATSHEESEEAPSHVGELDNVEPDHPEIDHEDSEHASSSEHQATTHEHSKSPHHETNDHLISTTPDHSESTEYHADGQVDLDHQKEITLETSETVALHEVSTTEMSMETNEGHDLNAEHLTVSTDPTPLTSVGQLGETTTHLPTDGETTYNLPEAEHTTLIPEEEHTTLIPEEEHTTLIPEEEHTTLIPETDNPPEAEHTTLIHETEHTVLSEDHTSHLTDEHLPETEHTTLLPESEHTTLIAETSESVVTTEITTELTSTTLAPVIPAGSEALTESTTQSSELPTSEMSSIIDTTAHESTDLTTVTLESLETTNIVPSESTTPTAGVEATSPASRGRSMFDHAAEVPVKDGAIDAPDGFVRGHLKSSPEPYHVNKPLVVAEGDLLRIQHGVRLEFSEDGKLTVNGMLHADGTEESWISFRPSGNANSWHGLEIIQVGGSSRTRRSDDFDHSTMSFVRIEGAREGVFVKATPSPIMHNVIVTNQPMATNLQQFKGLVIITDSPTGINVSNIIVNGPVGMELVSSRGPVILGNVSVHGCNANALQITAPANELVIISDPNMNHNNGTGIVVTSAGNVILKGGEISHNVLGLNFTEKELIVVSDCLIHDNDYGVGISTTGGRIQLFNTSFHNNNHHDVFVDLVRNGSDAMLDVIGCTFGGSGLEHDKGSAICFGCDVNATDSEAHVFVNITSSELHGLSGDGVEIVHPRVAFVMANSVIIGCNGSAILIEADITADVLISDSHFVGNKVSDDQLGVINVNVNALTTGSCVIEGNVLNENHAQRILRVATPSDNTELKVTIRNNTLKDNLPAPGSASSAMTVMRLVNVHKVVVTNNVFCNPEAACEVRAPFLMRTGLHIVLNAKDNFWGVLQSHQVYDRVCDFTVDSRLSILDVWPSWGDMELRESGPKLVHHDLYPETNGGPLEDDSNVVITGNAVVNVTHSIYVPPRSHLTIEPGASLEFQENRGILVRGELRINGEVSHPVRLGAADNVTWGGIVVVPRDSGSGTQGLKLNHVVMDKTSQIALLVLDPPDHYTVTLNYSTFSRSHHCLVIKGSSSLHVINSTFFENAGPCLLVFDTRRHAFLPSLQVEGSVFIEGGGPALVVALGDGLSELENDGEVKRLTFIGNTVSGVTDGAAIDVNVTGKICDLDISRNRFTDNPGGGIAITVSANQIGDEALISENVLRNSTPPVEFSGQFRRFQFYKNKISGNSQNTSRPISHLNLLRTEHDSSIIIRDNEFTDNIGETILSIKTECPADGNAQNSQFIRNVFNNSVGEGVIRLEGACMDLNFNKFNNPLAQQDLTVYHDMNSTINAINNWWGGLLPRYQDIMMLPNTRGRSLVSPSLNTSRTFCSDRNDCSGHGRCTHADKCECEEGWKTLDCSVPTCAEVHECRGQGKCLAPNQCECMPGWRTDDCGTPDCGAVAECSDHGECIEPNRCLCVENFVGPECSRCAEGFWGAECLPCSECKHGECSTSSGVCQCFGGWSGKLCDACLPEHRVGHECRATPSMKITHIDPIIGWHSVLRTVSIFGRNFPNATMYICKFGIAQSIGRWLTSDMLECNVPLHGDGMVLIQVAPPGMTYTTDLVYFTFDHRSEAIVSTLSLPLLLALIVGWFVLR